MKMLRALIATVAISMLTVAATDAQVVRRADNDVAAKKNETENNLSVRAKGLYEPNSSAEKDIPWMRVVYRQLDLTKDANLPLYYPEDPTEDLQNLFRILLRLLADNKVTAYEYLDGREVFTDKYKVNVREMLDRFSILYTEQKGSTEKNPLFVIDESDVPCYEVLSYYLIEKCAFNRGTSRYDVMIEAICPVLHRSGDFGGEPLRYPMFWLKYDDIRPYLAQQYIITGDANQVMQHSYDDYFKMAMYDGDIYKTRNLRNQSLMQQYPTDSLLRHAQDSIEKTLDSFEKGLWVLTPEEKAAIEEAKAEAEGGDATATEAKDDKKRSVKKTEKKESKTESRSSRSGAKQKSSKPKAQKSSSSSSSSNAPVRSVRRTK
ncbi:MAG: gliding motility protein GldN [Bacteroidaceae bacterium]|nr:gliding motility protein GldN [Bacteroidaceae bacterium]